MTTEADIPTTTKYIALDRDMALNAVDLLRAHGANGTADAILRVVLEQAAAPPDTLDGRPAGHTFEVECSASHTFDDPKAIRLDGHELDPGSIVRDGFGFDFPDRGSNDPTLVRLTIACRRVEFANYLPDGSSLLWEQNTDPTDFEEDPS